MPKKIEQKILDLLYMLFWFGVSYYAGMNHEPFADEAQAYLIARDASVGEIITQISRTEGTPALWYFWLKFLIFCGLDYTKLYIASILPNLIAVYLFIQKAPFPKYIKYLFPLTYFILYQYNIVSRNYSFLFLSTILVAMCFEKRKQHPYRMILSLLLLGSVSAHAFILSCSIVMFWIYKDSDKEKVIKGYREFIETNLKSLSVFMIFTIGTILYTYPEATNQYIQNYKLLQDYRVYNILKVMSVGLVVSSRITVENLEYIYIGLFYFIGMNYLLVKEYGIKYGILWLPNMLFMFLSSYKPWHAGILIMTALFMFWIEQKKIKKNLKIGVGILIITELMWSCYAIIKDINGKYAVSEEVYAFLQKEKIPQQQIEQMSFSSVGIGLYYQDKSKSYWDWRYNGFMKSLTCNDIKQKRAIIINKEIYEGFMDMVKKIKHLGNYQIKVFRSEHFFGLEDMSQDETLYVLYRK